MLSRPSENGTVSVLPTFFQVRRILCQVVIAMAHHHYLSLEGGHLMVEFVVRLCSLNTEDKVSG